MKFDPQIHHRRSIRLKDFDYSQAGAYFVTFVTQNRITMFGKIVEGVMQMNQLGQITQNTWNNYKISSPFNTMNGYSCRITSMQSYGSSNLVWAKHSQQLSFRHPAGFR